MSRSLCLDFPLRDDFMAQVVVPSDLTVKEAHRLCAMIQTLPIGAVDVADTQTILDLLR